MNYKIILDTYTIDIPEFIEKYDNANVKEKAVLNTGKFMDAINDHDYNYAYNCLAQQFKDNKFNTLDTFKEYIKANLFDKNEFEFLEFNNEGEIFIFSIKVTDANNNNNEEKILQVMMELGENRSFTISFNIK